MRIVSGIRPTGQLHIGHYLGTIKQWLELQKNNECIFFVADLHAITEPFQPKELEKNTMSVILDYLALGLDPKKCLIFIQSQVPEHTELAWIFETMLAIGELKRMTQFKDLSKKYTEHTNAGLFAYPALMAADILIYKGNGVPVGEDQKQHVELARSVARKFNKIYGKTFPEPKTLLASSKRLMSLTDPHKKMSKSDNSNSYIALFDSVDTIRGKIKRAVTDSGSEIKYDPNKKPAISNLLTIYSQFSDNPIKNIELRYKNAGYAQFKKDLAEVLIDFLKPVQEKRRQLEKQKSAIEKMLAENATRAQKLAQKTLKEVTSKIGLAHF